MYIDNVRLKCVIESNMNIVNSTVLRNNLSDVLKEVNKNRDFFLVAKKEK